MKDVYLVSLIGDMGKDRYFYLYEDKTIAEKSYKYHNDEMDEEDEYFEKFEDGDDEVKEMAYFDSAKKLSEYVKANDINIVEEYEGYAF